MIVEFDSSGGLIWGFGGVGAGNDKSSEPRGLVAAPGGKVWVADSASNRIQELTSGGEYVAGLSGGLSDEVCVVWV